MRYRAEAPAALSNLTQRIRFQLPIFTLYLLPLAVLSALAGGVPNGIAEPDIEYSNMSALFQHASELAIRAVVFLAQQSPGKLSPVHEIAAQAGVSEAYLAKITQRLASAGLVRTFRGPGKGMELGAAPETITLAAVVRAVRGSSETNECVLGIDACSEEHPCVLHREWFPLRNAMNEMLEKTTLADLVASLRPRQDAAGEASVVPIHHAGQADKRGPR